MERIELRYVFDCENVEKTLQYRYVSENGSTKWANVPVVYSLLDDLPAKPAAVSE
jgi:hypothetical protein